MSTVNRMIREEKMKRREQWGKIIGPIIVSLTGPLAVIVALVALHIKRSSKQSDTANDEDELGS